MNNYSMGDWSNPGTTVIKEDAVGFYLGGRTPHVWTGMQVHMQTSRFRHPIWSWGNKPGADGGIVEAHSMITAMHALAIPEGVAVSVDMETNADSAYLEAADKLLVSAGYRLSVYGSRSTIEKNPLTSGGRWVAEWTGVAHFSGVAGEWACQWQKADGKGNEGIPWDISLVSHTGQLWDTTQVTTLSAVLVQIPSGSTRLVHSMNNGATWQ